MKSKLDGIERDYWKRAAPPCTDAPAAPVLHAPRPVEEQ
jgi:hypothetical protein